MALKCFQEPQANITKDAPLALIPQEIPRAWGAGPERGQRPRYICLIINHNITGDYTQGHQQVVPFQYTF